MVVEFFICFVVDINSLYRCFIILMEIMVVGIFVGKEKIIFIISLYDFDLY